MFEALIEHSPIAVLLVDANGEIVFVNQLAERIFGYTRDELIGQRVEMLVPPEVRARHPQLIRDYFDAPLPRRMGMGRNLFARRKNGSMFPVEIGLSPLQLDGQTLVLGSIIDITDRLRAEHQFRAAFEAAPNGMVMVDSEGTIVLSNREIDEIFGYTHDELAGQPIELLVPEDFREPHPRFVAGFFDNPEPRAMGIGRELYGRHKSGRLIPVEVGLQPVVTSGHAFVIGSVVDITSRIAAEAEIKRKTEEIEEFSYRTSHDLRSPLKSIASMAECVLEDIDGGDTQAAKQGIGKIRHLTTRLLTLIEDLLTLTKADLVDDKFEAFDFAAFATLAKEKLAFAMQESQTQVEFQLLHTRDLVVQPARLTQVLDNLIGNGVKYADPSKAQRTVHVRTFNDAGRFFVQVADNGLGIPTAKHGEVFGMFKRFHNTPAVGSGLGLYIVKKQIDRLDAKIEFTSSAAGTTFYLEFPLVAVAPPRPE